MKKSLNNKLMRAPTLVLSYFGILLLTVVMHLAGLWTYAPLPQPTENSSKGQMQNPGSGAANTAEVNAPKEPLPSSRAVLSESSPTVTQSGYTIVPRCALWTAEGLDLYFSPVDPETICVEPPGSTVQAGPPLTLRTAQLPPNCAVGPDSAVYCLTGGQLTPNTLRAFYDRGELQTPKAKGGGGT